MKFEKACCVLLLLISGLAHCQKNTNAPKKKAAAPTIHEILIFKWCKDGTDNIKRSIKIDSLGNVIIKGQDFLEKVDMKPFTTNIHAFIQNEKVEKIPGNDDPPRIAAIPAKDRQNIYISIILTQDYINEKTLSNKSYYSWSALDIDKFQNDYPLFRYLEAKDVTMLKRFLE
jgi:hypothetical protein